ncbi:unnamed protein product [Peniophora sp. CBMAI 1063]|nr:unnamed protein product [Peniophora sp. CBMAI 1063]
MATTEQATRRTDSTSTLASLPPLEVKDDEISTQLKNVGSRIRRSVSQGYATHDPNTGDGRALWQKSTSHPTLQFGASAKAPIFISHNDFVNEEAARRYSRPATVDEEPEGESAPRSFAAVRSLPASAFSAAATAGTEEEEDWSSSAFNGPFAPAKAST